MGRKTKKQQLQFFSECLLPRFEVPVDLIDLEALIDEQLSTSENWRHNVKPRAEKLVDRIYLTKKELEAEIERYEAMTQKQG